MPSAPLFCVQRSAPRALEVNDALDDPAFAGRRTPPFRFATSPWFLHDDDSITCRLR